MDFFGEIQEVTTDKAQYRPGEEVKLRIRSWARVVGNGKYCEGSWNTIYAVRDYFTGVLLASDVRDHLIAYWTSEDYAEDDFWIPIGKAPAETTWVEVAMSAKNDITVDFTPWAKQIVVSGVPQWPKADIQKVDITILAAAWPKADIQKVDITILAVAWPKADIQKVDVTILAVAWPKADIQKVDVTILVTAPPEVKERFEKLVVTYKKK